METVSAMNREVHLDVCRFMFDGWWWYIVRFCRHTRIYYTFHIQSLSSPNMVRATRSSGTQDKDKSHDLPSPSNPLSSLLSSILVQNTTIKADDVQIDLDDSPNSASSPPYPTSLVRIPTFVAKATSPASEGKLFRAMLTSLSYILSN